MTSIQGLRFALEALREITGMPSSSDAIVGRRMDASRILIEHYQWEQESATRDAEKRYWLAQAERVKGEKDDQ